MKSATGTPWSVFDPEEHGCKGYLEVVHAEEGQHKVICEVIDHDNDRENAALIAAAPEMLKIIKDIHASGYSGSDYVKTAALLKKIGAE